jgi:hypothetical protein
MKRLLGIFQRPMKKQSLKAWAGILVVGSLLSGCGYISDTSSNAWQGTKSLFTFGGDSTEDIVPIIEPTPIIEDGEQVTDFNLSPQAAEDYLGQYSRDAQNKAFAAAPGGAFGVAFGYQSIDAAKNSALAKCAQDLKPGDLECVIYDESGSIVLLLPARMNRVP